jgi:putative DNA primase/helicase
MAVAEGHKFSEDTIALNFVNRHRDRLVHDAEAGIWYRWDGNIMRPDRGNTVCDLAAGVCREFCALALQDPTANKIARGLSSTSTIRAVVARAGFDQRIVRLNEQFDSDPMLMGTPGGTLDLTTGVLRPARPADLITMSTAIAPAPPGADCPRWKEFLRTTYPLIPGNPEPDQELIDFIQRYQGYSMTGDRQEQRIAFLLGSGRNGKGVMTETALGILGDYATVLPPETVMERTNEPHRAELAILNRKRYVLVGEVSKARRWNQARLMALSAGDSITANYMRQNPFTFKPVCKLWITANSAPKFQSANTAASERLMLIRHKIRFLHRDDFPEKADGTIAERDNNLVAELRSEYPAILRWMIDGCLEWQKQGLRVPKAIVSDSRNLVSDSDPVADWMTESCRMTTVGYGRLKDLFEHWNIWRLEQGDKPTTRDYLSETLKEQGYQVTRAAFGNKVMGLELNDIATQRLIRARAYQQEGGRCANVDAG